MNNLTRPIRERGGIVVCKDPDLYREISSVTLACRKEAAMDVADWDVCLVVRIGKAGEILASPIVAQLRIEWEWENRITAFWAVSRPAAAEHRLCH